MSNQKRYTAQRLPGLEECDLERGNTPSEDENKEPGTDTGFTTRQLQAIENLERALAKIDKYGLCLIGMDDSLLLFNKDELFDHGYRDDMPHEAMRDLEQGRLIQDHDAYIGSGGW